MSLGKDDAGGSRPGILRSPGSGQIKAVQIADPPDDGISPLMKGASKEVDDFNLDRSSPAPPKQHKTKVASAKLTGRNAVKSRSNQSLTDLAGQDTDTDGTTNATAATSRPTSLELTHDLASKLASWIDHERSRREKRRAKRKAKKHGEKIERRDSDASSDGSDALDQLQSILDSAGDRSSRRSLVSGLTKRASRLKLRRPSEASDADPRENEDLVPTVDVILDNSKTLMYSQTKSEPDTPAGERPALQRASSSYQKDACWRSFKYEIVRLTHTLRMRGWRRVPMQMSSQIEVIRLSGALTNCVYEVLPPKELPAKTTDTADGTVSSHPKAKPQKLLLRIYGTGVDVLIDREAELQILRRLRRKNIGPRLLGCFSNGRFEEFLHAEPLKPQEMRDPAISVQIAKRMRELHEGIDLLPLEREEGAFVLCSLNRWRANCEKIVTWLDTQSKEHGDEVKERPAYVCGTEWPVFVETVEKYRKMLLEQYGGPDGLKNHLVFAHNDTQYGNILRMTPEGESPLLTPANQHRQLQVIDFEYANANPVGIEFANHFSEWCYNYHCEKAPFACNEKSYPTIEEQRRFIHAYITHTPHFSKSSGNTSTHPSGAETPAFGPSASSLSSSLISNFMLDSRFGGSSRTPKDPENPDKEIEDAIEEEMTRLLTETRRWRLLNSAMWVMWGILRAKIPDLPDFDDPTQQAAVAAGPSSPALTRSDVNVPSTIVEEPKAMSPSEEPKHHPSMNEGTDPMNEEQKRLAEELHDRRPDTTEEGDEEDEDEFDYLAYAWERSMFFWGDAVGLGVVKKEDLPVEVRDNLKLVDN